ncbi:MAG: DUF3015 family protein [Bdellovibrionales bacterium]
MKKLLVLFVGLFLTAPAMADDSDGCGLGWQVTDKKTLVATTTRQTTNAVVPPSFGMTSGTIGCAQHGFAAKEQQAVEFVAGNYEPLIMEMAKGQGEYVTALSQTMGCKNTAAFGASLKNNYSSIVGKSSNAVELYNNVKSQSQCI